MNDIIEKVFQPHKIGGDIVYLKHDRVGATFFNHSELPWSKDTVGYLQSNQYQM